MVKLMLGVCSSNGLDVGSSVVSLSSLRMAKGLVVAMVVDKGGCVEMLKCGEGVASKETVCGVAIFPML